MWLFANKDAALNTVSSIGLNFSSDPVPGYSLTNPSDATSSSLAVDGPYQLEWRIRCGQCKQKSKTTSSQQHEEVSFFTINWTNMAKENQQTAALVVDSLRQTVKWMKTLRHPNILLWLASSDLAGPKIPTELHIVTERVHPLQEYLRIKADTGNFNFMSSWGLHQISRALAFLNDDAKLAHNAVRLDAIYVTSAGEWKLGGLDHLGPTHEPPPSSRATVAAFSRFDQGGAGDPYLPPDNRLVDSWGLGCLIWELYNPDTVFRDRSQLTSPNSLEHLPAALVPEYRRLVAPSATRGAKRRCTVAKFLSQCRDVNTNGFFTNEYVETLLFLEEIQLKDNQEKTTFLSSLTDLVTTFPDDVCRHKILPHLLNGLRYGSAGVEALMPVLRLIPLLSTTEFESDVLPCLVKLFAAPERATRVKLLEQLPNFVQNLPIKAVEQQIFQSVQTGFSDANPIVREATVRAMVHLAPKLTGKLLNDTVPRSLIGVQTKDEQGGIRTNATICLAKLAPVFTTAVQQTVLLNALLRATRDPFVPSRKAALTALASTQEFYKTDQLAGKLMPCLCFLTVDSDKTIRDDAFRAIRSILERLEQISENAIKDDDDPTKTLNDPLDSNSKPADAAGASRGGTSRAAAVAIGSLAWSAISFSSRMISNAASSTKASSPNEPPAKRDATGSDGSSTNQPRDTVRPASPTRQTTHPSKPMSLKSDPTLNQQLNRLEIQADTDPHDDQTWDGDDWDSPETTSPPSSNAPFASAAAYNWGSQPDEPVSESLNWDADDFFTQLTHESPRSKPCHHEPLPQIESSRRGGSIPTEVGGVGSHQTATRQKVTHATTKKNKKSLKQPQLESPGGGGEEANQWGDW